MGGLWQQDPDHLCADVDRQPGARRHPALRRLSTRRTSILEAAWASGTAVGRYAFWLGIFAAFLTAFYSWRLLFMTFHGKPRADHETMHHVA